MCLTIIAYGVIPGTDLLILSNRDEYRIRPASPLHRWSDHPGIVGGRDDQAGGTWLAVSVAGRLANVTNVREPNRIREGAPSRGDLVVEFLTSCEDSVSFARRTSNDRARNGFNLLLWDESTLVFSSNRSSEMVQVDPGCYAFSNGSWDSEWPKVVQGRNRLRGLIESGDLGWESLLAILLDERRASDDLLPDTGVGLDWERLLSPAFIRSSAYGTRVSTIVRWSSDRQVYVDEYTHGIGSAPSTHLHEAIRLSAPIE